MILREQSLPGLSLRLNSFSHYKILPNLATSFKATLGQENAAKCAVDVALMLAYRSRKRTSINPR